MRNHRVKSVEHGVRSICLCSMFYALCSVSAFAQVPNDVIIMRGLDFERQGRFEDAVAAFRQVLAREPANAQALLGAERAYAQLGRRDSTMALATRAVTADPVGTTAWTL